MKRWKKRIPRIAASLYFAWSCFVYFGTLGGNGHEWWPIWLYPIIWPLGLAYDAAEDYVLRHLFSGITNWMMADYASGAFYIGAGTLWIWGVFTLAVNLISHGQKQYSKPDA